MPGFTTSEYPRPKNDKEFEEIIRDLFAAHWKDEGTQIYGRSGQSQHGVDIYGTPNQAGLYFGIQCKLRNTGSLTRKEIEEEVAKARSFKYKLNTYIIVTTAPRDTTTQDIVDELNEIEQKNGSFKIYIRFWEDLCSLLAEHSRLIDKHFKEWVYPTKSIQKTSEVHPLEITKESPLLIGMIFDLSSSTLNTVSNLPKKTNLSSKKLKDAVNLVFEKAIAFCKTPEADDVLPLASLFVYGFGFGTLRRGVTSFLRQIGINSQRIKPELIPSENVRDMFAESASRESLPFTPSVADLNIHGQAYRQSIEAQFMDVGLGSPILYDALQIVQIRVHKELERPYYKYPLLIIISNGVIDNASKEDIDRAVHEMANLGTQIVCLYIGEKNIVEPKKLYSSVERSWPAEAVRLFNIASPISPDVEVIQAIIKIAKEKDWQIPDEAHLFMQINQSEMLEELVDIILSPLKAASSR